MGSRRRRDYWADVEAGLGSGGRIRILRYLIAHSNQQYTKYSLKRPTGLTSGEISRQIQTLVKLGWVKEFRFEPKTYRINMEHPVVKLVAELFHGLRLL